MKICITITSLLFAGLSYSQTFSRESFEKLYDKKSNDDKCNALYKEGFVKESSANSSTIRLTKKKFIKRLQTFEEEIVTISNDTLTYSFSDPTKYMKFRNAIDAWYKEEKIPNSNNTLFRKKMMYLLFLKVMKYGMEIKI